MSLHEQSLPYIRAVSPYQPGKPIAETERELGISGVIKLASNENPLGPSPRALDALSASMREQHLYPDASHFALKQALTGHLGVALDTLVVGNGSNEIIDLLFRVFVPTTCNAVAPSYSFIAYKLCAQLQGCGYLEAPLAPGFVPQADSILSTVNTSTRLVFLANPGNPTGTYMLRDEVFALAAALEKKHILLVLDYAYWEYVTAKDLPDALEVWERHPNVVVLRTFSKIYGLAGLRVGYAVAHPEVASLLNRARQPFNISAAGLTAAEAALGDTAFVKRAVENNIAGLKQVSEGLGALGYGVVPSQGNFILFDVARPAAPLFEQFLRKGVILRPVANYGLPQHLRVSIGTPTENAKFLAAAKELKA
jgi:histidinol-phosphate aminotransferase